MGAVVSVVFLRLWNKVMRALRGQNAGERERLRQEHLRMEALQVTLRQHLQDTTA